MTLLGSLSGATLLSYIYDPSPLSKFSKFSHHFPLRYTYQHADILFPTRKDLRVLNKQLNYRPRYSNKNERRPTV